MFYFNRIDSELIECIFSIEHNLQRNKRRIIEGQLRSKELNEYLQRIGGPKSVFLSEDGSGIVKKVVCDTISNQLVGLVLPTGSNGCPIPYSYSADSEEAIKRSMELPQSALVYIVVAQPLKPNSPPFILQLFGTDNKFKAADVGNRWAYITTELKK